MKGDILKWEDFNASPKARKSLAKLRYMAKTTPHPVVINIRKSQKENSGIDEKHLEATRQAVRLSGTEMILFDEDYHSAFDVLWTLETRHDHSISADQHDHGFGPHSGILRQLSHGRYGKPDVAASAG